MAKHEINCVINHVDHNMEVSSHDLLIDVLRDELKLISVKKSCEAQVCGACTVMISGKPVSACSTLAIEMDGQEVFTVEGLADGEKLHAIQKAFMDNAALQCGFCTSGMMMSAAALLERNSNPTEEEIRHYLHGNICRCTGYESIIKAVKQAALESGVISQ